MRSTLELNQRLNQRLSQQQIRFVRLLELNAPEMADAVERELEANPALATVDMAAENDPADRAVANAAANAGLTVNTTDTASSRFSNTYSPRYNEARDPNADADRPAFTPRDDSESLADLLKRQIAERQVSRQVSETADYIVGNLDNNGWLTRSLPQMMTDMAVNDGVDIPADIWEEAFRLVRSLDPPGVGAESLVDCLTLQLNRLPDSQPKQDALDILSRFFREYHMRHSHRIISGLKISRERLERANKLILSLNPKPGAPYGGNDTTAAAVIIPDFTISDHDGELYIRLAHRTPELTIEESFREAARAMEGRKARERKGSEFIISNYNEAKDFISLVRQRRETLMSVMTAIAGYQKEYFTTGDVFTLRPMSLRDLTGLTGLDMSTISRATNNKFVAMPWGEVVPLRSFFSGQVNAAASSSTTPSDPAGLSPMPSTHDGDSGKGDKEDELTNAQIQSAIRELVENEDSRHPMSDSQLREALAAKGYDVSRRTVAKYRDRSGIAIARLRRKL